MGLKMTLKPFHGIVTVSVLIVYWMVDAWAGSGAPDVAELVLLAPLALGVTYALERTFDQL